MKRTVFALTLLLALLLPGSIHAQTSIDPAQSALQVSPAITEHVIQGNKPQQFKVTVKNITSLTLPVASTVSSFIPLEVSPLEAAKLPRFNAASWFKLSEPNFILNAGESQDVTVTITAPPKSEPGGHYATLYFQPLIPSDKIKPKTTYFSARVGVLAFLIVPGNVSQHLTVSLPTKTTVQQKGPLKITQRITNDGNVHSLPTSSKVSIHNWRGKLITQLPQKTSIILPGTTKEQEITWNRPWALGKFTVKATLTYGTHNKTIESATQTFWVVPWLYALGLGFPGLLFVWFCIKTRRRWARAWRILIGSGYKQ